MAISPRSIKILWANAAGRCSFAGCLEKLCFGEAADRAPFTLGEMAHIRGERPGSNRHDPDQSPDERDNYSNLILLCPTHHTLIDKKENEAEYTVDVLHSMKEKHEYFVLERLDRMNVKDRAELVAEIHRLLAEDRVVWERFGPLSDLARKNPHSDEAHAVWVSERLSTIVPNNRRIVELLREGHGCFEAADQGAISLFLIHSRSYEKWVNDEISYEAVVRFPQEFNEMIERYVNASV